MYILKATANKKKSFKPLFVFLTPVVAILKIADKVHIRRVSISQLLIQLKSKYFLSKYTFSRVLITNKVFVNTLIQPKKTTFY